MAGLDISRSGIAKIEARLHHVDDRAIMFFAEALKVPIQDLFPARRGNRRLSDFMAELEVTRF